MTKEVENLLNKIIRENEQNEFREFLSILAGEKNKLFSRNEILLRFDEVCETWNKTHKFRTASSILKFFNRVRELLIAEGQVFIVHRYAIAKYRFYRLPMSADSIDEIDPNTYLNYKDIYTQGYVGIGSTTPLEIDFLPFYDYSPSMNDSRHIGNGIGFLNKYLSSSIFQRPEKWGMNAFNFLKLHNLNGKPLLINGNIITGIENLREELEETLDWLETEGQHTYITQIKRKLKNKGFEDGWGNEVSRIKETMRLLYDLTNQPDSDVLEAFISRIPMISKIAILSPHGWFGQENVLGKPDTGGQVIYILDQMRALENYLKEEFRLSGVEITPKIIVITRLIPNAENTTCDQRLEKIHDTENCWILRVPFRDKNGDVIEDWISRFDIWPYLDRFSHDAEIEILNEFDGRPHLILGNYSDGNLVATYLSDRLDVIQCTIAHALEKTKYPESDLRWKEMDADYHFSIQFTADMIAMNKSDFIITSTYQEIAGTDTSIGQYESYQFFTMPGLYQVVSGINLFNPKFNTVPPGVDERNYFPYYEKGRNPEKTKYWENRLFQEESRDIFGSFQDPEKPAIFTMARLDKVKNLTGLVEAFGKTPELKEKCNLIVAGGTIHIENSTDREEKAEIRKMYELAEKYELKGSFRWLPSIPKGETGEVYRLIADRQGVFVQPAKFEAFGLTILEAMLSGLPTFGPIFGGPSEIIVDGQSGFLMNTSRPELIASVIEHFFSKCEYEKDYWKAISEGGIRRVREKFTWHLYSEKLLTLTKLYGFWRYSVAGRGMVKMDRYCDLLYHLLFIKLGEKILEC